MAIMKLKYTNLKKKKSTLLKFNVTNSQISTVDDWFILGLSQHFLTKGLRSRNVTIIKKCLLDLKYELLETQFINRLYPPCGIEHKFARHNVFWNRLRSTARSFLLYTNKVREKSVYYPITQSNFFSSLLQIHGKKKMFTFIQKNILSYLYLKFLCLLKLLVNIYLNSSLVVFVLQDQLFKFNDFFLLYRISVQYKGINFNFFKQNFKVFLIYMFYLNFMRNIQTFVLKQKRVKTKFFFFNFLFLKKNKKFRLKMISLYFADHYFLFFFYNLFISFTFTKLCLTSFKSRDNPKFIENLRVKYRYTGINIDFNSENILVNKKNDYLGYILFLSVFNDLTNTSSSPNQLLKKKRGKEKEVLFSFDNIFQIFSYIKARNSNFIQKQRVSLGYYISLGIPQFWLQIMQQSTSNLVFVTTDFINFIKKVYFLTFTNKTCYKNSCDKQLLKSLKFKHFWQQSLLKQREQKTFIYSSYLFRTCSISYLLSQHLTYYMPLYIMPKHTFMTKNVPQRTSIPTFQTLDKRRQLVISWVLHLIKKNKNKTFDLKLKDELKKILTHETYLSVLNYSLLQKLQQFKQFIDYRW